MLRGSIVALVTPMLASGDIDWTSLAALVEYHVGAGTSAIVAVGTTGESVTLSEQEHIAVVEKTVEFAGQNRRGGGPLGDPLLQQTHPGRSLSSLLCDRRG